MRLALRSIRPARLRAFARERRAAHLVELAIVFPVFLTFLLLLFEVAYDQFIQSVLESTLQYTAYQVQVGNTMNTANGKTFIDNDLCPNALAHTLNCGNLYVRVQAFSTAACSDVYQATNGALPVVGGLLQLGDYVGETAGAGSNIGPTACGGTNTGFCNAGASQFIIMTAIYVAPTFLGDLFAGHAYKYNSNYVHAALATSAFVTEPFTATTQTSPC